MSTSLDINRLEKVKHGGSRTSARCPACAAEGGDKHGNNLSIRNSSGAFTCAVYPADAGREHRREIFRLVGIKRDRDPAEDREWRRGRVKMAQEEHKIRKVSAALRAKRASILSQHPWTPAEARAESPEKRLGWLHDPRLFIAALFDPSDIVWAGGFYDSGKAEHSHHWRTAEQWKSAPMIDCGPMVTPATWPAGTISRAAENVLSAPFTVLDFDGFDGKQPGTPEELREHITASLAIVRWLREALEWRLAAVLFTGSKSIHAWFHTPSPEALQSLRHTAEALGVDAGLIDKPEHPCRLPEWIHVKTGNPARVLWLQSTEKQLR